MSRKRRPPYKKHLCECCKERAATISTYVFIRNKVIGNGGHNRLVHLCAKCDKEEYMPIAN